MKIYIITDIEGISGVSGGDFILKDACFFQDGRRYYTDDINVCAKACFEAGAEEMLIRDGHASGNFALWHQLDSRIEIIQGMTPNTIQQGIEGSDALICLGFHAMAGTAEAVMEHTFSSMTTQNIWMNNKLVGEFGIHAAAAAEKGIPTILITGDDKVCLEAKELIPEIFTCVVKNGTACHGARLLSREKAHALIRAKTIEAINNLATIPLLDIKKPVVLRKESVERTPYPLKSGSCVKRISERIIETESDSVEKAFMQIN